MVRRSLITIAALVASLAPLTVWNSTVHAATFTVTSLADDGSHGTLRWAITQANSAAGADIISFDNSVTGTITLTSNLPAITDSVALNGPGQSRLTINGADNYRPFTVSFDNDSTVVFELSDITLTDGGGDGGREGESQFIFNSRATVVATRVTFQNTNGKAVSNWGGTTVSTYINCIFRNNGIGIFGDHGTTPSSTSSNDSDYTNRTYVVDSLFESNQIGIQQERWTKVTNTTFRDNGEAASIYGLNRTQILNSIFTGNDYSISHFNWTPVEWTSVGRSNRLHDGNTFINNDYAFYLDDSWNDGNRSQQWTTLSNNQWDGTGIWVFANDWNGQTNISRTMYEVQASNISWREINNVDSRITTTTTTAPPATTVPTATTVAPAANSAPANESSSTETNSNDVAAPQTFRQNATVTTVAAPSIVTTTVSPATTTTSIPAPSVPELSSGESGALVDGEEVEIALTRSNNALVVSGAGIEASVYGVSPDGVRIELDDDGLLRLGTQDQVVVEAAGYVPGNVVDVWMYSTPTRLGQLSVDATGAISGSFELPETLTAGDHRVVLDGQNNRGQDVVLGIGVSIGTVDQSSLASRLLIIIPVSLAILAAMIIPTTLRRRREEQIVN
jgi:hypothetical protein